MDRDRQQAREPESTAPDGGGTKRITDLPNALLTEVAKRLTTENPVETLENLTNFQLVNRTAREATKAEPLGAFHGRLKQLSAFVRTLRRAVERAGDLLGGDLLSADRRARMLDTVAYHPGLGEAYTNQSPHLDRSLASTSGSTSDQAVEPQSWDLDSKIKDTKESVMDLAVSVMGKEIHVDDLMPAINPIAKSISKAYNSARAELMSGDRPREDRVR
ncbi:virulence protein [Microvirga tunisiensis]|uniref:Virulence protein n=1 Tax=Microvirga tunisiensis TaxID=2108360 RepID=A0A5N7MXQ3_9HYPH|nr:virulence protein [Microvirga tunisiensis]MPR12945.1 virulence protein [Microvirga tunisiensis]MPR30874.1 virulence protein [Microvirga tunisiensis]